MILKLLTFYTFLFILKMQVALAELTLPPDFVNNWDCNTQDFNRANVTPKWQATLNMTVGSNKLFCGGSWIRTDKLNLTCNNVEDYIVILTAAHCLVNATKIDVGLGVDKISTTLCSASITPGYYKFHEQFDQTFVKNDIGILLIPLNDFPSFSTCVFGHTNQIAPIQIATSDKDLDPNKIMVDCGHGIQNTFLRLISDSTHCTKLPLVPLPWCRFLYNNNVDERQICAGCTLRSTCNGDSGTSLVQFKSGNYIALGITSFGLIFCNLLPGVFTKISYFFTWITDNVCEIVDKTSV